MSSNALMGSEVEDQALKDLGSVSYTAIRLQHATPQHLHITTRRNFIGPIPEGWLRSHRKSWYREALKLSNYSSRTATFTASFDASHRRALTGPNGLSASAIFQSSFPQPDDAEEDEGKDNEDGDSGNDDRSDEERKNKNLERASVGRFGSKKAGAGQKSRPDDKKAGTFESESPEASQNLRKRRSSTGLRERESTPSKINTSMSKPVVEHETGQLPDTPQSTLQTKSDNGEIPTAGDASNSTASLIPHGKDHVSAPIPSVPAQTGLVRFNIPGSAQPDNSQLASESIPPSRRRTWRQIRRSQFQPGEIVKMEKMLVRVDSTMQKLPSEYNENDSLKTESRIVEKWREFVVVCRESTDQESDFLIQMYKSRVIPAIEKPRVSKRATHEIPLIRRKTRINLYSVLDKTLVIWIPWKVGTRIYILRTHSSANAVEWYTFLRSSLGWKRSSNLEVHVPDLSVTLQLEDPFGELESTRDATRGPEGFSEDTITKVLEAERAATGKIIQRCIKTLEGSPEWTDVLNSWLSNEKMGLAWKRYDRLEWVHGANEQKMYGTIAMLKSYDLELRPKQHYPTDVKLEDEEFSEEPIPVEGFLIRLTSQRGYHKRFGKMFYKRLYFSTHNQFLCYCRPAKALPPPPPTLTLTGNSKVPSAHHIVHHTPLIYTVDPYPVSQGKINWLGHGNSSTLQKHDHEAYKEAERKVNTLLRAEGYINLSHIVRIRHVRRGSTPADVNIEQGSDVDFHEPVDDTTRDDGTTDQFDDGRTFEMVLKNGLIIRLQAYNERTKKEWMMGLNQLARYWKCRLAADMQVFKMIRQLNLERLEIDEEMESLLGQFAEKWEVTRAKASPQLFNMCGISCCRPITMSGVLYRKPKRHSTFVRCGVILCQGQLLIFHGTLRKRTGKEIPHIQHDRQTTINLKDCYIYSGFATDGDLLYRNQTFDSNHPGHHALPKIYLEDGWTSNDEDTMTCFVLWHGRRKSIFRTNEDHGEGKTRQRLRYVSRLGVPGRSIVFKARSRAERDHWVLSIGMEIERVQEAEHVRVVS